MPDILRILHLEDDAADAELIEAALAADGLVCEFLRVSSRGPFLTALDGAYDLIISDYSMPGFDGVAKAMRSDGAWPSTAIATFGSFGSCATVTATVCSAPLRSSRICTAWPAGVSAKRRATARVSEASWSLTTV